PRTARGPGALHAREAVVPAMSLRDHCAHMRHPNEPRASLLPRNFSDDVPAVALDPSFSHHFVSDVGAFPAITHVSCLTGHDAAEAMLHNRSLRSRPEEADMARRWSDLTARSRRLIIAVAVGEAGL